VDQRQAQVGGGHGGRERCVRVPVDERGVRCEALQLDFERGHHPAGLRDVRAVAEAEVEVGGRNPELVEEDLRQLVVVVLAGVDQDLVVGRPQPVRHGRCLDELRPVSDDCDDPHGC
jgi:hypothetical protein